MNETIGVKGGKNDRLRRMKITRKQKEKLKQQEEDQELKDLEKKVKKLQLISLLSAVPVAAVGQTIKTLYEDENKKRLQELNEVKEHLLNSNAYSEQDTKLIIKALETNYLVGTLPKEVRDKMGLEYKDISKDIDNPSHESVNVFEHFLEASKKDTPPVTEQQKRLGVSEQQVSSSLELELSNLKSQKLVEEYERQLKDIRHEIRELSFEYGVLSEATDKVYESKEADVLLDRLNTIIKKIEELKSKMSTEELGKYDENYLYVLIENYIQDFKEGKVSDDIKDSMLFILISEKLAELDSKKDFLEQRIEDKKAALKLDESKIEEMKERYFNYEKFNTELLKFQSEQDFILNDIKEKMKNATHIEEKVEVQIQALNHQSSRLLGLLGLQMMLPGARSAKGLATAAATYMYFMRNVLHPQTTTKRYKVIRVEDYSRQIENSISELNNVSDTLYKTSTQLKRMIRDFERDYKDYFDKVPECRALLSNLYKVQAELAEKEYELEKMKKEQEKNLEKNNQKVKTLDNRRVA